MGVMEKIKEAMKGGGDNRHTPADDAWEQVVSAIGPKLADGIWEATPEEVRKIVSRQGAENIFQLLSYGFARILPDSGAGAFVNVLQREIAGELREKAQKHRSGDGAKSVKDTSSADAPTSDAGCGVQGSRQILRLELERANRVVAWIACVHAAGSKEFTAEKLVNFLDKMTIRELRTFADLDDESKRVYAEACTGDHLPKVESESLANKIANWFASAFGTVGDWFAGIDGDLSEIALIQDEEIRVLEEKLSRIREETDKPLGFESWKFWKL